MYTPTPEEQEWIDKSQDPHMASMCAQIAAGFNRLDFRLIGAVLDDECTYGSQTVDIPLLGKLAIGDYLTGQFKAKKSGEGLGRAFAQWARESLREDPCVLFHQRQSEFGHIGLGDLFGYVRIKCNDAGKVIECFTVSLLPEPVAGLPVLVHLRRDFLACDKALRAQIAQPAVRSFRVVMLSSILNDDAGFG